MARLKYHAQHSTFDLRRGAVALAPDLAAVEQERESHRYESQTLEAKAVIDRRYQLLAVPGKQWIKPVSDQVVESLYHIFAGRIRYVMNAITSLISHLPNSYARSLDLAQATTMFQAIVLSEVKALLHGTEEAVFLQAAAAGRFTNSELGARVQKSKQQIQKYLNNWLGLNLVSQKERIGRNQFYEIDPRFAILREQQEHLKMSSELRKQVPILPQGPILGSLT
jgi:hypothetical protein